MLDETCSLFQKVEQFFLSNLRLTHDRPQYPGVQIAWMDRNCYQQITTFQLDMATALTHLRKPLFSNAAITWRGFRTGNLGISPNGYINLKTEYVNNEIWMKIARILICRNGTKVR